MLTPSESQPVTLEEIKDQCRIDPTDTAQDALLMAHAQAARQVIEEMTGHVLTPQTYRLTLDGFPGNGRPIEIPRVPVIVINAVQYYDGTGTLQTWDSGEYVLEGSGRVARLAPGYGYSYPSAQTRLGAVLIEFDAGYGSDSPENEALPEALRTAVLLKIQSLYDGTDLEATIANLTAHYKVWGF